MKQTLPIVVAALLLLPVITSGPGYGASTGVKAPTQKAKAPAQKAKAPAKKDIDPRAIELVKKMSDYLGHVDRFSVHIDTVRDAVLPSGLIVNGDRATDLTIDRPNKLRANISSAARNVQIYYDGATLTVYTPAKNVYGSVPAPASLDLTVQRAVQRHGMAFPGVDLLLSNPYHALMKDVTSGYYVGKTLIRGNLTHQLAFRQKDLDWQLWIDAGNIPLPRRFVIVDRSVKGSPRVASTLTDWNTTLMGTDALFTFVPPPGAQKIDVLKAGELPGQKVAVNPKK